MKKFVDACCVRKKYENEIQSFKSFNYQQWEQKFHVHFMLWDNLELNGYGLRYFINFGPTVEEFYDGFCGINVFTRVERLLIVMRNLWQLRLYVWKLFPARWAYFVFNLIDIPGIQINFNCFYKSLILGEF